MATIGNDPNGRKRILFVANDGTRKTVRIGKASKKQAEAFKLKVEALVTASITGGNVDDETARWVAGLHGTLRSRLEGVGLVAPRVSKADTTLGTLLKEVFAALQVKPGTLTTYTQTRTSLADYFGESRPLSTITPLDAEKWRQSMQAAKLAQATISKRVKTARQIFRQAVQWDMLTKNPFDGVKAGAQTNRGRMYFITRSDAQKVIDACPNTQWRVMFALSRFGGLRCPSEHLRLKWSDVDWEHSRIHVTSPKTEHHEGGGSRSIPLFSELRPYLMEAFEQAEEGAVYVVTHCRDNSKNLRTQLVRIIKRAGLTPWPKTWHNLRSSRQTELAANHPIHVVCAWLGNSRAVAQDHYLQVTDSDFTAAVAGPKPAEKAAQNPAQYTPVTAGTEQKPQPPKMRKPPVLPEVSARYGAVQDCLMTPTGSEHPRETAGKQGVKVGGGTESGTVGDDLQTVAKAWPFLSPPTRKRILALVERERTGDKSGTGKRIS
jgi:integrase